MAVMLCCKSSAMNEMESKEPEEKEKAIPSPSPPPAVVPDGGWGWFVVFSSMFTHIIIGGQERANGILYLAVLNKFDGSATITAGLVSFTTAFQLLFGPISGALIKRFSGRTVGVVGGLFLFVSFLISSFVTSIELLFITYGIIGGVAKSLTYTASIIMVGYYFDQRRGIAVGIATAGVGLGTFIYAPLMEWSFKTYSFFGTMIILAGIALNLCPCSLLYRPLQTKRKTLYIKEEMKYLTKNNVDASPMPNSDLMPPSDLDEPEMTRKSCGQKCSSAFSQILPMMKSGLDFQLLRNFHFLCFCLNICMFTSSHWSIPVFLPALSLERGVQEMEAALLISIIGISDLISRILMGIFLDMKCVKPYRRFIFTAVIGVQVIMTFSCSYATKFWQFALICITYGSLSGGTIAQLSVIIVDLLGVDKLASSFGWTLCFSGIGILLGPPIAGKIKDSSKGYSMIFFFAGGMMSVGLLFLLFSAIFYWWEKKKTTRNLKINI